MGQWVVDAISCSRRPRITVHAKNGNQFKKQYIPLSKKSSKVLSYFSKSLQTAESEVSKQPKRAITKSRFSNLRNTPGSIVNTNVDSNHGYNPSHYQNKGTVKVAPTEKELAAKKAAVNKFQVNHKAKWTVDECDYDILVTRNDGTTVDLKFITTKPAGRGWIVAGVSVDELKPFKARTNTDSNTYTWRCGDKALFDGRFKCKVQQQVPDGSNEVFIRFDKDGFNQADIVTVLGIDTRMAGDVSYDHDMKVHISLLTKDTEDRRRLGWKPSHDILRRREGFHHTINRVRRESERQS